MFREYKHIKLILVIAHILVGALLETQVVANIYGNFAFVIAMLSIILSRNKNEEVLLWSLYFVGLEVLMRMTSGFIFSEFTKYAIIVFIFTGLAVESKKHPLSLKYFIYILLLLIGIIFVPIYDFNKIRQEIAFNLSGPFLLGLASIYFYRRNISIANLTKGLSYSALPVIAMVSYLFFKTPNFRDIVFKSAANFETSGGFGPNQVATIIGFGFFVIAVILMLRKRLSGLLILDILLMIYIVFRGLLTFSRGGMLAGVIAIIAFSFYFILANKNKLYNITKYVTIILLIASSLFLYASSVTSGILSNRYLNKTTQGDNKEDITSGRTGYFELELEAFYENPIFGVGVGGSKHYRALNSSRFVGSSHNELSRLLCEHGAIGVFIIIFLLVYPLSHFLKKSRLEKGFLISFYLFWFLTINHSAMRLAFPAFIYGLSLMNISFDEKNTLYRKQLN